MSFRLVPKLVTLNGVMAVILHYLANSVSFRGAQHKSSRSLSHLLTSSCKDNMLKATQQGIVLVL